MPRTERRRGEGGEGRYVEFKLTIYVSYGRNSS
jgi:hypothetical protein